LDLLRPAAIALALTGIAAGLSFGGGAGDPNAVPPRTAAGERSHPLEREPGSDEVAASGPVPYLPADVLVARGEIFLDQADRSSVTRANQVFRYALQADPASGAAYAGLARVAAMTVSRRWEEDDALVEHALEMGQKATELSPGDPRSHAALAAASLLAEEGSAALEAADRAWSLRAAGTPPWVEEIYAQALLARGDPGGALGVLEGVRSRRPERVQAHYLTGNALLDRGDLFEALDAYRRATLLDPDFVPALLQTAYTYDRLGNRSAAGPIYEDVSRRFPEVKSLVFTRMAASMIARRDFAEALSGLEQTHFKTRRGLGEGTVVYLKGACHEGLGRFDEARGQYRRVIEEYPMASLGTSASESLAAASYEALARIEMQSGRPEEAVRLMEQAVSAVRPTPSVFLRLAAVYSEYSLHDEAYRLLERAAAADFGPRPIGAKSLIYAGWARASRRLTENPGASGVVLQALERDADQIRARGDVYDYLQAARACAVAGSPTRALEWVRHAVNRGYHHLDWVASDAELAPVTLEPGFEALRKSAAAP